MLIVCTANRCRSPLAAAILRDAITERDLPAEIVTAGLRGSGRPATTATAAAGARRGLDLAQHRSQPLGADLIAAADVVLGIERTHVLEAVVRNRSAWPRAFTFKELVRRGEAVGPRGPVEATAGWLARVGAGRARRDLLGRSSDDDLADPTGGTAAEHDDLVWELEDLAERLAALLAAPLRVAAVRWRAPRQIDWVA